MPKFNDIPQFTPTPTYQVDVGMSYLKEAIKDYKKNYNLQMNPDFQRGHVWTEQQKINFMEFMFQGGTSAKNIYFNHSSWMKVDFNTKDTMVLVDGLQRLTAALDFLDNKIKVFGYYYEEYEDTIRLTHNDFRFHINDLKTKEQVLKWYLEMNTGGVIHTEKELNRVRKMLEEEQK